MLKRDTAENHPPSTASAVYAPVALFFLLAYAIAWGVFLIFIFVARRAGVESAAQLMEMIESLDYSDVADTLILPVWLLYFLSRIADFSFSIAGVIMIFFTSGTTGLKQLGRRLLLWKLPVRWYVVALVPFLCYGLALLLTGAMDSTNSLSPDVSPKTLWTILFSANAGIVFAFFLRGAMGEELGLRGFALPRLQTRLSPARASAVIGVFWVLWHLPVLVGRPLVAIIAFCLLVFCLSFVFTALFNGAKGSLLPVMIFHALQNSEEVFETLFPTLGETQWETLSILLLLVVAVAITLVMTLRGKPAAQHAGSP